MSDEDKIDSWWKYIFIYVASSLVTLWIIV